LIALSINSAKWCIGHVNIAPIVDTHLRYLEWTSGRDPHVSMLMEALRIEVIRTLLRLRDHAQEALIAAARDCEPVRGLTHTFYKYPARFSPLVCDAIQACCYQPLVLVAVFREASHAEIASSAIS
jgi:hypothetical protein